MLRDRSSLFVTGPDVLAALGSEPVSDEELGGAALHAEKSGLAAAVYDNDLDLLFQLRRFIAFLPRVQSANWRSFDRPERREPALQSLVPDDATRVYDVKEAIGKIVDEGDFFEIQHSYAPNLIIGLGRIAGRTVGVIANQPLVQAGVIDCAAARKGASFLRFCAGLGVPIVTFVDAPGFCPGVAQEAGGLAREVAELVRAYAMAPGPKVSIVLRNGFGGAYLAMGAKPLSDIVYAWPSARVGISGVRDATSLSAALAEGVIDAVINPAETRRYLVEALAAACDPTAI